MNLRDVEHVGSVPLDMFPNVREALGVGELATSKALSFLWPVDPRIGPEVLKRERALTEVVDPLITIVNEREGGVRSLFLQFRVDQQLAPGHPFGDIMTLDSGRKPKWHRDNNVLGGQHKPYFATADGNHTEFKHYQEDMNPGGVFRWILARHRAPTNNTDSPLSRTWVQAIVLG